MSKIDLSRRQFVNVAAAAGGLYAISGMPNLILGEEPQDVGLKKVLGEADSKIPYIGITEDGDVVQFTAVFGLQHASGAT